METYLILFFKSKYFLWVNKEKNSLFFIINIKIVGKIGLNLLQCSEAYMKTLPEKKISPSPLC